MHFPRVALFVLQFILQLSRPAHAVIFLETENASHNTKTPGDNSGWQYTGKFNQFLGVPIAPHFFITAAHVGGGVGDVLNLHGDLYTVVATHPVGTTDLRIWEVDHAKPFPTYAPLSSGAVDVGATVTLIGRGTQRGADVEIGGELKGWQWGVNDGVQRWGRNVVTNFVNGGLVGELLYCDFDSPGIPNECHLSVGDSGGAMFVLEDGLWRLAGINYAVDGPFRMPPAGAPFHGTLFDAGGLQYSYPPNWVMVPEAAENVPSSFYCSRISSALAEISAIAPEVNGLAPENFDAWRKLYFSPAEIAGSGESEPLGDSDGDGISNLLEYSLNLDPTYSDRVIHEAEVGLRGLPLVRREMVGGDEFLSIEFVRRSVASGTDVTAEPQFSSDLTDWQTSGTETVVPANPRWERVKRVDSIPLSSGAVRFARLKVVITR